MKVKHSQRNFKTTPFNGWADQRHLKRDNRLVHQLARKHGIPTLHAGVYLDWIRRIGH